MIKYEGPIGISGKRWAVLDKREQTAFSIEQEAPECAVRNQMHFRGRGPLLVRFVGPDSFEQAVSWAEDHIPTAHRKSSRPRPKREKAATRKILTT